MFTPFVILIRVIGLNHLVQTLKIILFVVSPSVVEEIHHLLRRAVGGESQNVIVVIPGMVYPTCGRGRIRS